VRFPAGNHNTILAQNRRAYFKVVREFVDGIAT